MEDELKRVSRNRSSRRAAGNKVTAEGWNAIPSNTAMHFRIRPARTDRVLLKNTNDSPGKFLYRFFSPDLIQNMLAAVPASNWILSAGSTIDNRPRVMEPKVSYAYKTFAVQICLSGHQIHYTNNTGKHRPLVESLVLAKEFFESHSPFFKPFPGENIMLRMHANLHITNELFPSA